MIQLITLDDLDPDLLKFRICPNLNQTYYWSPTWDPELYVALARAGFISISLDHPEMGPVLLAELQARYAVLDWEDLHVSRQLAKLLRSSRLAEEEVELRVVDEPGRVIERLVEQHRKRTWLAKPYVEMLHRLPTGGDSAFALQGVELWSRKRGLLIAGELGYSIGRTYTSLSGFHTRDASGERTWAGFGTLQMWMLAGWLQERGYAFWNLGHTGQDYKRELGARELGRGVFLGRWLGAVSLLPHAERG
jgi:Leu/Phe-tRNA-protein transferase